MKGVVFTEFLDHAEARFGALVVERAIEAAELPSGGAYTAVGTYPTDELLALVRELSRETGVEAAVLVREFGERLFDRLAAMFPQFLTGVASAFDFLERVDGVVHVEVRKLYPDADLPSFRTERTADDGLRLEYRSERPLADLAEGLILGCARHFGTAIEIARAPLPMTSGYAVAFDLRCPTRTPATMR
jgi:hypothetical protein